MNESNPRVKNPFARLCLATLLTVWGGANVWSVVFRWREIWADDMANRSVGLLFAILLVLLPLVVAIWLLWSVTVGPEGLNDRKTDTSSTSSDKPSPARSATRDKQEKPQSNTGRSERRSQPPKQKKKKRR